MDKSELRSFGANVRMWRERAGISQEELAHAAGLHRTYVGGVERGERNVGVLNLLRISRALSVPIGHFFEGVNASKSSRRHRRG